MVRTFFQDFSKLFVAWTLVSSVATITSAFSPNTNRRVVRTKIRPLQMLSSTKEKEGSVAVKHVVIAGGGVIGTCTSYYLAKNFGISSTIVDPSGEIAPAASGKAGGFLALDWNDMSPIRNLARRSFALHQSLADALGAQKIDYRRLTCASIGVDANRRRPSGKKFDNVEWAKDDATDGNTSVVSFQLIGNEESIAQVHPKKLCQSLWEESCRLIQSGAGAQRENQLIKGKVVSMVKQEGSGSSVGVQLEDGQVLEADAVLLACGPWTANIMTGVKYHSVIIPTQEVLSQCVFFAGCGDPEVYVRPDSTAYCTGFPDAPVRVTEQPGQECVRYDAVEKIISAVRTASGKSEKSALAGEPALTQACYLPSTPDGLPIMGPLPKESVDGCENCYVAAGHSCWGILLGPATGETMANLIATGATATDHVSLGAFQPARFRNIEPFL